jgi:hypothetical protein
LLSFSFIFFHPQFCKPEGKFVGVTQWICYFSTNTFNSTVIYRGGHKAISRRVVVTTPDEVNDILPISVFLILPAALSPGVYSNSNINEYHKQRSNVSGE